MRRYTVGSIPGDSGGGGGDGGGGGVSGSSVGVARGGAACGQGLTLVPISAQLELLYPPCKPP
jgi:hypothetical protein